MMNITLNDLDKKELETIANYLDGKFNDFGKKKKDKTTKDDLNQLLQMTNTIGRLLALATEY